MKSIAIISNSRMMLLFLLLNKNILDDIFFILDESLKDKFSQLKNVTFVRKPKGKIDLILLSTFYFLKFSYLRFKLNLSNLPVYGADHISGSKYFLRRNNFFLLEDGTANFLEKNYHRSLKNKIFSIPSYGLYKNVKVIYLTTNENIPNHIIDKVEVINLSDLWNKKNSNNRMSLLSFFNLNESILSLFKNKDILLFTQPLSEDGVISEPEKLNIYRKIIEKYDKKRLIIKPHPREKTNYKSAFPDIDVLVLDFPSEFLFLLGIKPKKVITLFSTAVFEYDKDIVDFYGTRVDKRIYQRFGDIHYKTNSLDKLL